VEAFDFLSVRNITLDALGLNHGANYVAVLSK
jgi:hypothetical protein